MHNKKFKHHFLLRHSYRFHWGLALCSSKFSGTKESIWVEQSLSFCKLTLSDLFTTTCTFAIVNLHP